ncbi:MAG TPA: serine/threonine-protein kinase [Polyangiaceae bacterium]
MASVHLGRLIGPAGFSRTVAIKRMHQELAHNPEFVAMFLDEARLAARISHPNVVPTLDVVALKSELLLVMEYVCGDSLMGLINKSREGGRPPPIAVAVDCAIGMLNGLHAAHEAKQADGRLLSVVHRDVTPHNVLVGLDGVARVVDFGIARASGSAHRTRIGEIKGKLSYLAPEQLQGAEVSRATDIYSASLVLWESLTCEKLFKGENEGTIIHSVLEHRVKPPSQLRADIPQALDAIVLRGLDADPLKRWETAKQMAEALEDAITPVARSVVASWVQETARGVLRERQENLTYAESYSMAGAMPSNASANPSRILSLVGRKSPPESSGAFGLGEYVQKDESAEQSKRKQRHNWVLGGGITVSLLVVIALSMTLRGRRTSQTALASTAPFERAALSATPAALSAHATPPPSEPLDTPTSTSSAPTTVPETATVSAKPATRRASPATQHRVGARAADPLYRRD